MKPCLKDQIIGSIGVVIAFGPLIVSVSMIAHDACDGAPSLPAWFALGSFAGSLLWLFAWALVGADQE